MHPLDYLFLPMSHFVNILKLILGLDPEYIRVSNPASYEGVERYCTVDSKWTHPGICGCTNILRQRRPVKTQPVAGEGYRLLQVNERLTEGDESCLLADSGQATPWTTALASSIGFFYAADWRADGLFYRRKDADYIDVGEGYRPLGLNEIIQAGDEFNSIINPRSDWLEPYTLEHGDKVSVHCPTGYVYRRKVEPTTPEPPVASYGYRLLEVGEQILEGDEFEVANGGWASTSNRKEHNVVYDQFQKDTMDMVYRRKVEPTAPATPSYRILAVGEQIFEGDEWSYKGCNHWTPTQVGASDNAHVDAWDTSYYRRKISPALARAVTVALAVFESAPARHDTGLSPAMKLLMANAHRDGVAFGRANPLDEITGV